jgi:hypothetical protein
LLNESILESLGAQPWESFRIGNLRVISLTGNVATVIYKVTAQRRGSDTYAALVSSTYVHDKSWLLVFHQQTPA